jgi:hypothetical protein
MRDNVCFIYISFACHPATVADLCDVGRVTNDLLPDVALLEIFDCYMNQPREEEDEDDGDFKRWFRTHAWHTLAHVCRKWRTIVFGSPRRLKLRLLCKETTPVKEMLAVWPPLPIVIGQDKSPYQMDNIIVALEHNDRVCEIRLSFFANTRFEQVLAAMQQPFLALTRLDIGLQNLGGQEKSVIPESFLGGSAPRRQYLKLEEIPFPRLPKLLSSATGLVTLRLVEIPHSGFILPEAMVRCLSTLTRLESLSLEFKSPLSRPVRKTRHPHPPTRSILFALTEFFFVGVSEYLEDLVARIDAPLLDAFDITFFHQLIFNTPQIARFVARSPNIQPPVEARIVFVFDTIVVTFSTSFSLGIRSIRGNLSDLQLSSLAQICSSSSPEAFIPTVEHLYICGAQDWRVYIEDSQWLEVLRPFTAVKYLYLSSRMAPPLQNLAGEVLPSLQNLFLEDYRPVLGLGAIRKFVDARQLVGHPITVSHWHADYDKW